MSLFRKPAERVVGLKILAMGETGVGKSVFALSFPKAYALDAEAGLSHYENGVYGANLLGIANTQDFNELQEAIEEISEMVEEEEGSVQTLIVDSETKFFQNLTDASLTVAEKQARKKGTDVNDASVSIRGYGRIKAVAQRLANMKIDLSAKGVNIVSIAQVSDIKQKVGENFVKIGEKPVMQKGSEYDADICLKLFTETDLKGNVKYKAEILKDRTGVTKVGQIVDNPSYNTWKEYLEGKKGGVKVKSNLSSDSSRAIDALEQEDIKNEKTIVDRFKEAIALSPEHQAKAVEMIKAKKIKNPLQPTATELKALEEIVVAVESL